MVQNEKVVAQQAAVLLIVGGVVGVLLVLDLLNRGLVWRVLQSLKSRSNSTLPGEQRTVGKTDKADVTFLS